MAPETQKITSTTDGSGDILSRLCQSFMGLALGKATGTLQVLLEDGSRVALLFQDGGVMDVDTGAEESLLAEAILSAEVISERELRKVHKRIRKNDGLSLGVALFGLQKLSDEDLLERTQELLVDHACRLFTGSVAEFEFTEHAPQERLEGFNTDVSDVFDILFAGEDIFFEAMRRVDRWDLVQQHYPVLLDIYYATPRGMRYYSQPREFKDEIKVLKEVDGILDLGEVIANVALPPFETLQILQGLIRQGDVQQLSPIQVFQIGVDALEQKNFEKARKILQRAMDLGLDDFDIQYKLAEALEALQRREEAKKLFLTFAEKCIDQNRASDAIRSYRHAVEGDPLDAETQRKLVDLLLKNDRMEEALVQGMTAAESLDCAGNSRAALDHLLYLREKGLKEPRLSTKLVELAGKCGRKELVEEERSQSAAKTAEVAGSERDLERYQRLFCEGDESVEVRIKLVELHLEEGNRNQVTKHINGILGSSLEDQIEDVQVLVWLHKTRCSLCPGHLASSRWLIDHFLQTGKQREAILTLENLIQNLEKEEEIFYVLDFRKRLVTLQGDNFEHRWELARLFEKLERIQEALKELETIAVLAARRQDLETARRAWSETLRMAPFHRKGLLEIARILEVAGDRRDAADRLRIVLALDLLGGELEAARDVASSLETLEPDNPVPSHRVGAALVARGEKQAGVERLVRAAELYLERKDLGSAREAVDAAHGVAPQNRKASELGKKLEELEAALAGGPPRPESPPAAATPAARAPAAAPQPEAPPPGQGDSQQDEAFQPRAPIRKGTVNAITARLRNLKGGDETGSKAFSGKQVVQKGLKSISANLKNLQKSAGGSPAPEASAPESREPDAAAVAAAAAAGSGGGVTKKKGGVLGVASRLKSLARGGGVPAPPGAANAVTREPEDPEAASDGTSAGESAEETAEKSDAGPGASAGATPLGGALVAEQMQKLQKKIQSGGVQTKKSLGGPASRLARLRAQKRQAAATEEAVQEEAPQEEADPDRDVVEAVESS